MVPNRPLARADTPTPGLSYERLASSICAGKSHSRHPTEKEHFAGFFLIDVESRERAQEIAAQFSGPGETVELRPAM